MRIYTRGGDKGKTGIHGGERVDKDDIRIEANGTLDELTPRSALSVRCCLPIMNGRCCWVGYSVR